MSTAQRVIYIAANASQAHLLCNLLQEHGIDAYVINDTLNSVHFGAGDWMVRAAGGPGFLPTAPKVVVDEADAEQAREIALQVDEDLRSGAVSAELMRLEEELGEDDDWPKCPHCSRPRLASCPVCETSATHFPAAFMLEAANAGGHDQATNERMVICPTCDEAFAPRFPARCEWCGHRFADGIEEPQLNLHVTPPIWQTPEFNSRIAAVILGLLATVAGVTGWFYYVLH